MRLVTKILSFLMLLVLLTAEDCGNNSGVVTKEERMTGVFQNIEDDFAKDELSDEILSAFEKRAVQKLKDISDYINIYADTNLSVQFRSQANQMIRENFYRQSDLKNFYSNRGLKEDSINSVLYHLRNGGTFRIGIDSLEVQNHLRKSSDSNYSGLIQYSQKIYSVNSSDTVSTNTSKYLLNISAIKIKKNFGDKTEDVWEVYLGEVKL